MPKCQFLFSAVFGFRNPSKKIFSELDEINAQGPIFPRSFQNTGGDTKWGDEAPTQQAALACRRLVAPLHFSFGVLEASWKNKILGVDFVQFREYFLTRISETKNSRKDELALRHLVNRLVPENASKRYKV